MDDSKKHRDGRLTISGTQGVAIGAARNLVIWRGGTPETGTRVTR